MAGRIFFLLSLAAFMAGQSVYVHHDGSESYMDNIVPWGKFQVSPKKSMLRKVICWSFFIFDMLMLWFTLQIVVSCCISPKWEKDCVAIVVDDLDNILTNNWHQLIRSHWSQFPQQNQLSAVRFLQVSIEQDGHSCFQADPCCDILSQ